MAPKATAPRPSFASPADSPSLPSRRRLGVTSVFRPRPRSRPPRRRALRGLRRSWLGPRDLSFPLSSHDRARRDVVRGDRRRSPRAGRPGAGVGETSTRPRRGPLPDSQQLVQIDRHVAVEEQGTRVRPEYQAPVANQSTRLVGQERRDQLGVDRHIECPGDRAKADRPGHRASRRPLQLQQKASRDVESSSGAIETQPRGIPGARAAQARGRAGPPRARLPFAGERGMAPGSSS